MNDLLVGKQVTTVHGAVAASVSRITSYGVPAQIANVVVRLAAVIVATLVIRRRWRSNECLKHKPMNSDMRLSWRLSKLYTMVAAGAFARSQNLWIAMKR